MANEAKVAAKGIDIILLFRLLKNQKRSSMEISFPDRT